MYRIALTFDELVEVETLLTQRIKDCQATLDLLPWPYKPGDPELERTRAFNETTLAECQSVKAKLSAANMKPRPRRRAKTGAHS